MNFHNQLFDLSVILMKIVLTTFLTFPGKYINRPDCINERLGLPYY